MIKELKIKKDDDGQLFLRVKTEDDGFDLYTNCVAIIEGEDGSMKDAVTAGWIMEKYRDKFVEGAEFIAEFERIENQQRKENAKAQY